MSAIACCNKIVCPGVDQSNLDFDTPLANLTSELPDKDLFIGLNWGWDNNVPPLGSNFSRTSCLGLCTSAISQDDADACAARAELVCASGTWGPPGTSGPPPTHGPPLQPPPSTGQALATNQSQTCTVICPDGNAFAWTVAAGYFISTSLVQANEMAYALACRLAYANMICMGALSNAHACVNSSFSASVAFTGGLAPFTTSITSGSLPPGLSPADGSDKRSFLIFGTPTTAGDYTFTLKATDSRGNYMQKTFTIHVLGITNATTLAHAMEGRSYSQQLNGTGGTAPLSYVVVSGSLGSNLTVSSTGLITGTPGYVTSGSNTALVKVTDADGYSCTQNVTVTTDVAPGPNWDAFVWSFANSHLGSGSGSGRTATSTVNSDGNIPFAYVDTVSATGVTYTGPAVNVRIQVTISGYNGTPLGLNVCSEIKKAGAFVTGYCTNTANGVHTVDFSTGVGAGEAWTVDDVGGGNHWLMVSGLGNVAGASLTWQIFNL